MQFTVKTTASIKLEGKTERIVFDDDIKGFGLRLREGGSRTWIYQYRIGSKQRRMVLGSAKSVPLSWRACRDDAFGAIVKLLLLTGQRKSEIGFLHWDEVHDEQIALPAARTKNKRDHVVPLSDDAKAILDKYRVDGRTHVFGRYDTGFGGWNTAKLDLDARIAKAGKPLEHWTLHDLRRTAATRMADLGVQPHIIEAVLNHVSGHKGGVAGIYNRATYDKEKREALALWGEHVMALVEGRKAVVLPMKRA